MWQSSRAMSTTREESSPCWRMGAPWRQLCTSGKTAQGPGTAAQLSNSILPQATKPLT